MKQEKKVLLIGVAAFFLFLLFPTIMQGQTTMLLNAADLIISFEGFIPVSKWDNKQYSWGYGTRAPGPGLSITKAQARDEMVSHIQNDYNYLSRLVTVSLNSNQWAALLSFSFNEGEGGADNLVPNINAQDWDALETQWKKYIYAGGVVSDDLIQRRESEWQIFVS